MASFDISGSWVALVTPFKNGSLDLEALTTLIERQIEGGTTGLVILGTTGEAATVSEAEYELILSTAVKLAAGRCQIMAGTGSNSTKAAIDRTKLAAKLGAKYALVVTPYYNKPTPAGQIAHFKAVAEEGGLPVVLYNVPGRTGTNMLPETVATLAKIPGIIGIKEASGNLEQMGAIIAGTPADFTLLSGDDGLTMPAMAIGAKGVISVSANVVPAMVAQMVKAALSGDWPLAKEIHYKLRELNKMLFIESNPIPVKSALAQMGLIAEEYRLPLVPLQDKNRASLAKLLSQMGLIGK